METSESIFQVETIQFKTFQKQNILLEELLLTLYIQLLPPFHGLKVDSDVINNGPVHMNTGIFITVVFSIRFGRSSPALTKSFVSSLTSSRNRVFLRAGRFYCLIEVIQKFFITMVYK